MSIQEIEIAIAQPPHEEFWALMEWLDQLREKCWDQQIAQDWENGRFDEAIARAKKDCAEGRGTPL